MTPKMGLQLLRGQLACFLLYSLTESPYNVSGTALGDDANDWQNVERLVDPPPDRVQ
jgi:hypothetical protein